jgi:PTH1 family peptidyl-tRNA hydrolase
MVRYFKIPPANVLVIYDDLDLPLGMMRFRLSGSAGGHRGLTSIIKCLGTQEIPRLRMGIGRPAGAMAVVDFVLSRFSEAEQPVLNDILNYGVKAAAAFITEGPAFTMNHFNINLNKPKPERKAGPDSGAKPKPAAEAESEE